MKALSTLSVDKKLNLISKLTYSIHRTKLRLCNSITKNSFTGLFGTWEYGYKEAGKLIDDIKAAHYFVQE